MWRGAYVKLTAWFKHKLTGGRPVTVLSVSTSFVSGVNYNIVDFFMIVLIVA